MNTNTFLDKDNINTLWDVISDEDIFKFLSRDIQSKVAEIFMNNIKGFFEVEKIQSENLIDINKKYIILILNHIKKNYVEQIPNKIKISNEPTTKQLITYEEIQNERKSQFDQDLQQRQQEFENIMTIKAPPVPEFSDNYSDKPITEMEKMIQQITSKRNYDVEQINKTISHDDSWLKPQETSIKNEKYNLNEESQSFDKGRLKYLSNDKTSNNKSIDSPTKKNVTWENDIVEDIEENIFKKLKKIQTVEPTRDNNIHINFDEIENHINHSNHSNHSNRSIDESTEYKITVLQNEVKTLNSKLDMIIELIKQNK